MSLIRTQIYLTSEQRDTLKETANRQHVSLSELMRQMVDENIQHLGAKVSKRKQPSFIGIGASGLTDLSINHDKYIAEAIAQEHDIR